MSIHKLFAANLREECLRFVSIAEVCRGADINRQQFNKYLSGQALPNPRTLARLCKFLGVEEPTLFELRKDAVRLGGLKFSVPNQKLSNGSTGETPNQSHVIDKLAAMSKSHRTTLKTGYYFCYMPFDKNNDFLLRAVIKVSAKNQDYTFCRRTSFKSVTETQSNLTVGKHSGLVITDSLSTYLVGRNNIYPHEVSILKIAKSSGVNDLVHSGLGFIYSVAEQSVSNLWLEWLGDELSIGKSALKKIGVVPKGHASLSDDINRQVKPALQIAFNEFLTAKTKPDLAELAVGMIKPAGH